jgi:NADH dehydrogenase FAD-containing subunit
MAWNVAIAGGGLAGAAAARKLERLLPKQSATLMLVNDVNFLLGLPFPRDVAEVGSIGHPRPLPEEAYARGGTHRPVE